MNPILYNLTLPNISESLPSLRRIHAVTSEYPRTIHTSVRSDTWISDTIVGKAIIIIFVSSEAINVPIVVLLNAVHL
jgi:hypothetical protein